MTSSGYAKPVRRSISDTKTLATALVLATGLAVCGCYRPDAHLDTVTPVSGNSIAHNKAVHTIDPWPPEAFRRDQVTDGERVRQAYESYRGGNAGGESDGSATAAPGADDRPTAPTGAPPGSS